MIAKIWTGVTRDQDADAHEEYMRETAVRVYSGRWSAIARDEQFLVDRDFTVRHCKVYGSSGLAQ